MIKEWIMSYFVLTGMICAVKHQKWISGSDHQTVPHRELDCDSEDAPKEYKQWKVKG